MAPPDHTSATGTCRYRPLIRGWGGTAFVIKYRTFNYLVAVGNLNLPGAQEECISPCDVCYEGWSNWLSPVCLLIQFNAHGISRAVPSMFIPSFLFPFGKKKLQLYHVLMNFEPEKAKKLQTLGVVLKVRVILEWNWWIGTCLELWALAQTTA